MDVSSSTASQTRDEFLQLLVAQLRNQDPLQPVKQEDFLAQLAQFSTLEGIEKLNSSFEEQVNLQQDALWMGQLSQASSLIGRDVAFSDSDGLTHTGSVSSVQISDGGVSVLVDGESISIDRITRVSEATPIEPPSATEGEASTASTAETEANAEVTSTAEPPASDAQNQSPLPPMIDGPVNVVRRIIRSI